MRLADLEVESQDGVVVVRIEGEIDLSNAGGLRGALMEHMTNDVLGLVLDFTDVGYLDSAGIHVLFELLGRLQDRGQQFRLVVAPDSQVAQTLQLVGASSMIGIFDTAGAALAATGGNKPAT
jgi:anti-sigma B factor antagonist